LTNLFSIYRSSAGSGKTRTLAKEYLKFALKFKADYFKYILAVTFTNKASQEMKNRILSYLDDFAQGKENELANELKTELNLDDQTFQSRSQETQAAILHTYAHFSISTIDAFFQKVIRSFTRESGLLGDYKLEVDQDAVLTRVIDNLIDELGSNKELTDWVVEFARENLENERAWDVRSSLIEFAKEIFREEFKDVEEEIVRTTAQSGFFKNLKESLWKAKNSFISEVSGPANEAIKIIASHGWTIDDFSYGKTSGLNTFFRMFASEKNISKIKSPGDRIRNHFTIAANWPGKKTPHAASIKKVAEEKLVPMLNQILQIFEDKYTGALSAELALKNLYVFGLISDISRKLKEYKDENNLMLLADAPKFLNGVIQDSDTPFIYEKVGSFYRNYLIDEFQDTSGMQWKNFQPLITNSLDSGHPSLVVGDVKQAIYRWRGGDLSLLQQQIISHIGQNRVDVFQLDKNFRSAQTIVDFNNALFKSASTLISAHTGAAIATQAYTDVAQEVFRSDGGAIQIKFINEPTQQKEFQFAQQDEENSSAKWQEQALAELPRFLEMLQEKGVALRDIAILVRKNEEGQRIATHLLQYKTSGFAKAGCAYDVVSNESLRIDGAASVNLLLGAMRYLLNAEDAIARAQLGYEFSRIHERHRSLSDVFSVTNQSTFENNLPEEFSRQKPLLKKLALIELAETLIGIFGLGKIQGELIYLQAFQDLVLDFYNREKNDLGAFLEWWDENKHKKSIQISGGVNAAQIITIHKSKGLQFKYVIIPFCSWGLDHDSWQAPNLWVKSNEYPFANAGFLPLKYGKQLEETYFKEYYATEKTKTYLDNLNLLYVAFTRAELGLIATAPSIEVRGSKDSVAGLLYNSIQQNGDLKEDWSDSDRSYKKGAWTQSVAIQNTELEAIALNEYNVSNWREKLVIKQTGAGYFQDLGENFHNKQNYGIHMHEVFSRMKYAEDVDQTLEQIVREGLITSEEQSPLKHELTSLLSLEQVSNWFDKQWTVYTEVPILSPGGAENRIDRLLVKDKTAVIVDFKTGEKKKSDHQQVLDYMDLLRQMNYQSIEGYLLYLSNKEIVEVMSGGKPKSIKKVVNKDQLTLGL
jgi:ATP-dependent exoDNAse (exonuclease V) beta subunit